MKLKILLLSFTFYVSCCMNNSSSITNSEFEKCYRDMGANNYYYTYTDYILVSNYRPHTFRLKDLVYYAQKYIDTIHSEKPVSGVFFSGQPPCEKVFSTLTFQDTFSQLKQYGIFMVGFANANRDNNIRDTTVSIIAIPEKGDFNMYVTSKSIDSLLSINPFIK